MRAGKVAAAVFSVGVLAGCGVGLASLEGESEGVVYHLPRSVLEITVRQYTNEEHTWYVLGGPKEPSAMTESAASLPGATEIVSHSVPDLNHRYVIKYNPSGLSDDRLCISRSPGGLLHDVQFAADDRTPQVVFNIARFLAGFGGQTPASFSAKPPGTAEPTMRAYTGKVDPFNDADIRAYNNALEQVFGDDLKLDFTALRTMSERTANALPQQSCTGEARCKPLRERCDPDHICYRTMLKFPVHLKQAGERIDVRYADVASLWDVGAISVTRAFLVQKITKLRFENGTLISAIIRKPSEVEEVTLLPLSVMNAVLTVPSGLWTAALTDQKFKEDAQGKIAGQEREIANLKKHYELMLQGARPEGMTTEGKPKEDYTLNCQAGSRGAGINVLNLAPVTGQ